MKVKSIHIWTSGDPDAGIGGNNAEVIAPGEFLFDTEEIEDGLEDIRLEFAGIFSSIWGEIPVVMFDFEMIQQEVI